MVIFEDLDLELLRRQRQSGSVLNWNDRRTDLYQLSYTPPPEASETEPLGHRLSDLLTEEHVSLRLASTDRASVLHEMAEVTFGQGTEAAERATELLAAREKISTTAVGHGVAIPHCRSPDVQQIRLAIGFSADGIDFQASDGAPVRVVVSVVSPADAASHHLGVLARLATLLRSETSVRELLAATDPREVVALLRREDARLEQELAVRRTGAGRVRPQRPERASSGQPLPVVPR
jgi:mannitol/fructose-specific phosphotransferase system IIA component (Ntr-type)